MANTAMIDSSGFVTGVYSAPDNLEHPEFEGDLRTTDERMTEFFNGLGIDGEARQTSYNDAIRKQFAGIGMSYDSSLDMFISPQPYPSWTLDAAGDWQPPEPQPSPDHEWDESALDWIAPE